MEKVYIAREVIRVRTKSQNVTKFVHATDGGELKETTRRGNLQRTFYCQKCARKMHAPLQD